MNARWSHVLALAVAFAGVELAMAFGDATETTAAYVLAAGLGVVVFAQGESNLVQGSVFGNVLLGFVAGTAVALFVGTSMFAWYLSVPFDLAIWRMGLLMWGSWAGVGVTVLSAFFLVGLLATLR